MSNHNIQVTVFAALACGAGLCGCSTPRASSPTASVHREHLTSVSRSYGSHEELVSRTWPANHLLESSATWQGPPAHSQSISILWLPTHVLIASNTWPASHDGSVSRVWWPGHTVSDSHSLIWPPMHAGTISGTWEHSTALSEARWPPNHYPAISDGWGPDHSVGISLSFPPAHWIEASVTWPGPEPWPSGHALVFSQRWYHPSDHTEPTSASEDLQVRPQPWPVFPADHAWYASLSQIAPMIRRNPWPPQPSSSSP